MKKKRDSPGCLFSFTQNRKEVSLNEERKETAYHCDLDSDCGSLFISSYWGVSKLSDSLLSPE